ncbi:SPOSA6832_00138 [Sporobolomyces salmonicolor]|uniref:SPOSA6832_00138-mRNA-1:cds n=1 Tax=Sporidiobolus salmonicolor TaxID=5005 RepID=A0A0D6EFD4_SPOSA|nr:SPOSA6832_00138 [Sporobolomyces salmonicolor]
MSLPSSSSTDLALLLRTAHFASIAHASQRRKSRLSPAYIQHPLDVARRLAAEGSSIAPNPPVAVLQAAMLHDVIEDTDVTEEELRREFGEECSNARTTSISPRSNENKRKSTRQRTNPTQLHVKLSDKLSNLTDLMTEDARPAGWSVARVQEYFVWSKRVTDLCVHVNPGLGEQLDRIYREGTFEYGGKSFKCHPSYP